MIFGQSFVYDSAIPQMSPVGYVGMRVEDVSAYMANDNHAFTLLTDWMTDAQATDSGYTGSGGLDFSLDGGGTLGFFHSTYTGEAPDRVGQNWAAEPEDWTSPYYDQPSEQFTLNHTVTGLRYQADAAHYNEMGPLKNPLPHAANRAKSLADEQGGF